MPYFWIALSFICLSRSVRVRSDNLVVKGGSTQRTKQTSGFGKKNKEKFIRRGAEVSSPICSCSLLGLIQLQIGLISISFSRLCAHITLWILRCFAFILSSR